MKYIFEESDMETVWHHILESLDIMKALASADTPKEKTRKYAKNGVRKLTCALKVVERIRESREMTC